MRHGKKINHLSRTSSHRKAMLANMASSLILYKRITTTTAKAKALKTYVEPLITKAKQDNTHSRRMVFSYLQDKDAVSELFRDVVEKVGDRPGGYTRILKTGNRNGDNAEMCFMELVDYNETYTASKEEKQTSSRSKRRRRRGGKKKSQSQESAAQQSDEEAQQETQDNAPEQSVSEGKQDANESEAKEEQQIKDESAQAQQQDAGEEGKNDEEENKPNSDSGEEKKDE